MDHPRREQRSRAVGPRSESPYAFPHSDRRATIGRWSAPLFRSAASISLHTDVATEFAPSPVRHYTVRTARVRSTRRNSMPVMKISSFDERKFGGIRLPSASPFFLE
jgi:hypothetical protein